MTVKLSRKFYDRFGDDIAAELVDWFNAVDATYQLQLREVNELNWERFKAELHAQGAELRRELHSEIGKLRQEMLSEIGKLRQEMHQEIGKLRQEMHQEIGKLRQEMHQEIGKLRAGLLKWMFIYWTGTVVTIGGLVVGLALLLRG